MIKIGIIGDFYNISSALSKIYSSQNKKARIITCFNQANKYLSNTDILIINYTNRRNAYKYKKFLTPEILIINNIKDSTLRFKNIPIVLINSDNLKNINNIKYNKSCIITYGYNSKSCLTLSSISSDDYNTIQCCIQRTIPTISGKLIYEQEFSVITASDNITSSLAAVTAAILYGTDINKIKKVIL